MKKKITKDLLRASLRELIIRGSKYTDLKIFIREDDWNKLGIYDCCRFVGARINRKRKSHTTFFDGFLVKFNNALPKNHCIILDMKSRSNIIVIKNGDKDKTIN